jgi:hypothetical protein
MIRLALISAATLITAAPAVFAQGLSETVTFTLQAQQPSLFDSDRQDVFRGTIDDRSGTTVFDVTCSAGASAWLGLSRIDEACSVTGSGIIKNPNNPAQTLPRINYQGGFTIEADADGYTNVSTILANYLRAGSAGAENKAFGGNVVMMPENPSSSALALSARLLENLQETATGTEAVEFDTAIDSIRFENFTIPHVGLGDTVACSWTGDAIFAYANNAWQMEFDVKCGDASYRLEGNMPLVDAPAGSDHAQEYNLNLVLPGAGGGDPFAAADPFAAVDGLTGVLRMTNAGRSTEDGVYESVTVEGQITGQGLPLELVRGYAQILSVFGRTFFGA